MGKDIHVAIAIRNTETGYYDKVEIFNKKKDKYISIPPYNVRNYELFNLLEEDIPFNGLHTTFLEPSFAKEILGIKDTMGYFGFKEVNFADLKNYLICNPTIILDDDMVTEKTNPIKFFIERIEYYIEFAGYEYYYPSDVYILYWFDN